MAWSNKWLMKLNIDKCSVLSIMRNINKRIEFDYTFLMEDMSYTYLKHDSSIRDLGILIDEKLSFSEHINEKINNAYKMLGIIGRNF